MTIKWKEFIPFGSSLLPKRALPSPYWWFSGTTHIWATTRKFSSSVMYMEHSWCRVIRNILSLVTCGWSLDLTCLYLVLMDIQWTLVSGCLGIRALAGIIIFGRVAGKSKLAGNQHLCFVCLWFSIRHTHLLKECNQLKEKVRMLLNENRKLLVEQADQEASFGEEKSSVMRPARTYIPSAKQQQVGWCVSEADCPHG